MSFHNRSTSLYYRSLVDLHDKLQKSEDERMRLQSKFNELLREAKQSQRELTRKIQAHQRDLLDENLRREQRNDSILRALDMIERRLDVIASKTNSFHQLTQAYQTTDQSLQTVNKPAASVEFLRLRNTDWRAPTLTVTNCNSNTKNVSYSSDEESIEIIRNPVRQRYEITDKPINELANKKSATTEDGVSLERLKLNLKFRRQSQATLNAQLYEARDKLNQLMSKYSAEHEQQHQQLLSTSVKLAKSCGDLVRIDDRDGDDNINGTNKGGIDLKTVHFPDEVSSPIMLSHQSQADGDDDSCGRNDQRFDTVAIDGVEPFISPKATTLYDEIGDDDALDPVVVLDKVKVESPRRPSTPQRSSTNKFPTSSSSSSFNVSAEKRTTNKFPKVSGASSSESSTSKRSLLRQQSSSSPKVTKQLSESSTSSASKRLGKFQQHSADSLSVKNDAPHSSSGARQQQQQRSPGKERLLSNGTKTNVNETATKEANSNSKSSSSGGVAGSATNLNKRSGGRVLQMLDSDVESSGGAKQDTKMSNDSSEFEFSNW